METQKAIGTNMTGTDKTGTEKTSNDKSLHRNDDDELTATKSRTPQREGM